MTAHQIDRSEILEGWKVLRLTKEKQIVTDILNRCHMCHCLTDSFWDRAEKVKVIIFMFSFYYE